MKFNVNQQDLQQALNYCQGVIEKRSTLPILSNILMEASNSKLTITATDLDLIFIHQLNNVEILEEGKTTTTSSIMYDIVRKFSSGNKINLTLTDISKLQIESEKSIFNLNCIELSGTQTDPLAGLIFCGPVKPRHVLVNGSWVVRDSQLSTLSLPELLVRHDSRAKALFNRA